MNPFCHYISSNTNFLQLYSEELITVCLSTIKNQLTKIVYPFVEASTELASATSSSTATSISISPLLRYLILQSSSTSPTQRRLLSETFQALSAVIPRINTLVNAESVAMSDAIIIQAVYIAIGPFFVVENVSGDGESGSGKGKKSAEGNVILKTFGKSAMRGLRLDALALIRSVSPRFASATKPFRMDEHTSKLTNSMFFQWCRFSQITKLKDPGSSRKS